MCQSIFPHCRNTCAVEVATSASHPNFQYHLPSRQGAYKSIWILSPFLLFTETYTYQYLVITFVSLHLCWNCFYRFCFMCITELLTSCTLYFVKDDKNEDVQSIMYHLLPAGILFENLLYMARLLSTSGIGANHNVQRHPEASVGVFLCLCNWISCVIWNKTWKIIKYFGLNGTELM